MEPLDRRPPRGAHPEHVGELGILGERRGEASGIVPVPGLDRHLGDPLDRDGSRASVLAERAGIGRAAMGELIVELERLGYVERRPDPDDRRAKRIVPTAAALDATWRVHAVNAAIEQRAHRRPVPALRLGTALQIVQHRDQIVADEHHLRPRVDPLERRDRGRGQELGGVQPAARHRGRQVAMDPDEAAGLGQRRSASPSASRPGAIGRAARRSTGATLPSASATSRHRAAAARQPAHLDPCDQAAAGR